MLKSKILKTEYKSSEDDRKKWASYMRERRLKIKNGEIIPVHNSQKNKSKSKDYHKNYQREARFRVITHYGGKCECCGENKKEFLAIDHIKGGGRQHRKIIGGNIARWIIMNNFPKEFRILCHNCNMSLGVYGYCPHNN